MSKIYWKILIWNHTTRLTNLYWLREYRDGMWKRFWCGKKIWNSYQENKVREELKLYILDMKKYGRGVPNIVLEVWNLKGWYSG